MLVRGDGCLIPFGVQIFGLDAAVQKADGTEAITIRNREFPPCSALAKVLGRRVKKKGEPF